MNHLLRQTLLSTLAVAQFLIGAGAGERVVYLGATHAKHEHCPHADSPSGDTNHALQVVHALGIWSRVIGSLPIVVPVDFLHRHDAHTDCEHVHLRGQDSGAVGGPVVVPRPVAAALPAFLSEAASVSAARGVSELLGAAGHGLRPPSSPSGSQVRLLI